MNTKHLLYANNLGLITQNYTFQQAEETLNRE